MVVCKWKGLVMSGTTRFMIATRKLPRLSTWKSMTAVLFVSLLQSPWAMATIQGTVGTITSFRIYTISNSLTTTRDVAAFQVTPALTNCVWAWVDPTDASTLAVVLSAKTTGASITVNYDDAIHAPWGDASMCVLTLISLN